MFYLRFAICFLLAMGTATSVSAQTNSHLVGCIGEPANFRGAMARVRQFELFIVPTNGFKDGAYLRPAQASAEFLIELHQWFPQTADFFLQQMKKETDTIPEAGVRHSHCGANVRKVSEGLICRTENKIQATDCYCVRNGKYRMTSFEIPLIYSRNTLTLYPTMLRLADAWDEKLGEWVGKIVDKPDVRRAVSYTVRGKDHTFGLTLDWDDVTPGGIEEQHARISLTWGRNFCS